LLRAEAGDDGAVRYSMLETVREFALEWLEESGEAAATRDRFAAWCLAMADHDGWYRDTADPDAAPWLDRLERERANLAAALVSLSERGDGLGLVRLAGAAWSFWQDRGYVEEGRHWLERAIERGAGAAAFDRMRVLVGAGNLAWRQADLAAAQAHYEAALALARELGEREAEAFMLNNLAATATELGDHDLAAARHDEGLALARTLDAPTPIALSLYNLANLAWLGGRLDEAAARIAEALAVARGRNVGWLVPGILVKSGFVAADRGDHAAAARLLGEGLRLAGDGPSEQVDVVDGLEGLARLAAVAGRSEPAARLFGAAAALRAAIETPQIPSEEAYFAPVLADLRAWMGDEGFAAAWAAGQALPRQDAIAEALAAASAGEDARQGATAAAAPRLTPRERDVLRLLAAGEPNRAIADRLFISPATVARHLANLYAKLSVDSRARAVAAARRHGIA
jgi:DNA-binding CsgD family transcriptional regulator/tetratricopeptide (TPR) repeat protein